MLKPHRDVEFFAELTKHQEARKLYAEKYEETKNDLTAKYKAAGIASPRMLFPAVADVRNTLSLPSSRDGPMRSIKRLHAPGDVESLKADVKAPLNSFKSIDNCLLCVEKLRRDLQRAKTW